MRIMTVKSWGTPSISSNKEVLRPSWVIVVSPVEAAVIRIPKVVRMVEVVAADIRTEEEAVEVTAECRHTEEAEAPTVLLPKTHNDR
jgi:hypothetical protein